MSEAWVVNASPLILFARIGRLDLIEGLARTTLITRIAQRALSQRIESSYVNDARSTGR